MRVPSVKTYTFYTNIGTANKRPDNFFTEKTTKQFGNIMAVNRETNQTDGQVSNSKWLSFLFGRSKIDTSKSINWDSVGENKLTQEQIDRLKEEYDVENLTPQQQYDLLADLSNMGVLSGEDCRSFYMRKMPEGANGMLAPANDTHSFTLGNALSNVTSDWNDASYMLGLLRDPKFYKNNPQLIGKKDALEAFYEDSKARNENIMNVFKQLKRK